jgi:DNA-binding NarL/FixJ family response regulator
MGANRPKAGCSVRADVEREYRVMVVDDHPIWRDAVARDLAEDGFQVVATADGVASARRRAAVVTPDVVVMDMRLSDGTGALATAEVLAVSPSSATTCWPRPCAPPDSRAVFTPGLAGLVLGEYRRMVRTPDAGPATPSLTERETEVLRKATFRKLQVANRVELARYAIEHGLDRE